MHNIIKASQTSYYFILALLCFCCAVGPVAYSQTTKPAMINQVLRQLLPGKDPSVITTQMHSLSMQAKKIPFPAHAAALNHPS